MTYIPEKVATLVKDRLPEFIKADYQTFVAFIEAYYEFLEQSTNPRDSIRSHLKYRDIDTTLDEFIDYFKKQYAVDIPESLMADKRLLYKHLKELYTIKGTEAGFKLLFRILFGKDIEIDYPSKKILRASDGRWIQDFSIFVRLDFGNPENIVGRTITAYTIEQPIPIIVERYRHVEDNIYELFIDRRFYGNLKPNDAISFEDSLYGYILTTTSGVKILQAGKNFKLGEVYELINGSGSGTFIKVSEVDSNGGIKKVEFIRHGTGYGLDFTNTIVAYQDRAGDVPNALNIALPNITFGETYSGFIESGSINEYDYNIDPSFPASPAIDSSYAGTVVREFYYDNSQSSEITSEPAVIQVTIGAVAKYPGYYLTNDGFLNDAIYIQDSKYYQAFSYVIKVDEQLASYKDAVKNIVHPAGMAMFGEYDIRNTFDVSAALESAQQDIILQFNDEVFMTDSTTIKSFVKALADYITTSEVFTFSLDKYLQDSFGVEDSGGFMSLNPYAIMPFGPESYFENDTEFYIEGAFAF